MKNKNEQSLGAVTHTHKYSLKNKKAITLVALVVTLVVLLVLVGVVVDLSLGEKGILGKTKIAVDKYKQAEVNEQIELAKIEDYIDNNRETITISTDELVALIQSEIKKANEEKNTTVKLAPVGTIISCIRSSIPDGYLPCDGKKYSVTEFPNLYAELKDLDHTGWKAADWETEFTVPDLQGEFLRGTGTNGHTNQGNGDVIGRHQNATVIPDISNSGTDINGANSQQSYTNRDSYGGSVSTSYYAKTGTYSSANRNTWLTSRPTNTSVLYCIKY